MKVKVFLITMIVFMPIVANAFDASTRDLIIKDAILFCPDELRAYLKNHTEAIQKGARFMDRRDNHMPADQLAAQINGIHRLLASNLNGGKLPEDYNTVSKFGLLASFLSEIVNPSQKGHIRPPQASGKLSPVVYDGHHAPKCPSEKQPVETAYNQAVNTIVDYWVSAWTEAGRPTGKLRKTGVWVSHKEKNLPGFAKSQQAIDAEAANAEAEAEAAAEAAQWYKEQRQQEDLMKAVRKEAREAAQNARPHTAVTTTGDVVFLP